jgi:hypothetical protein
MNRSSTFKKRDVAKAYKAIVDAGGEVSRIEITEDGCIVLVIAKRTEQSDAGPTELDTWMAKHAR